MGQRRCATMQGQEVGHNLNRTQPCHLSLPARVSLSSTLPDPLLLATLGPHLQVRGTPHVFQRRLWRTCRPMERERKTHLGSSCPPDHGGSRGPGGSSDVRHYLKWEMPQRTEKASIQARSCTPGTGWNKSGQGGQPRLRGAELGLGRPVSRQGKRGTEAGKSKGGEQDVLGPGPPPRTTLECQLSSILTHPPPRPTCLGSGGQATTGGRISAGMGRGGGGRQTRLWGGLGTPRAEQAMGSFPLFTRRQRARQVQEA